MVGGIAFLADFGILYFLTDRLGLHYLVSATLGFLCGMIVNYLLCIAWVFDFRRLNNRAAEFAAFGTIGIAGLALNNLLLFGLTEHAGLHYLLSKLVAAAIILVFNFSLRRYWLFSPPTSVLKPKLRDDIKR